MLATRFGAVLSVLLVMLLAPYFLIESKFSFEDFMASDSNALDTAAEIDQGVGGVVPLYIRVPLAGHDPNAGDADFERIRTVHALLEGELGDNKVISVVSMPNYTDSGFSREEVLDAVGLFLRKRFVTDDGSQGLVTGFMPAIINSNVLKDMVARITDKLAAASIEGAEVGAFAC
ncbi:MAG: hypothetical protein MO852_10575 [Candidatus Devosia euplotis]|nr:hypothetical protein [Candidatus Devosia euplotis]